MAPLRIEILARAPTEFFHCPHCELAFHQLGLGARFRADQRAAALPPDVLAELGELVAWIQTLVDRHGRQVQVSVVDVASIEGFLKALRYRAWRYPTIVANGEVIYQPGQTADGEMPAQAGCRLDLGRATREIERRLEQLGDHPSFAG